MLAAALIALALPLQAGVQFRDEALGLELALPAGSEIRRERLFSRLLIPIEGGAKMEAQIFRGVFAQEKEVWQRVQFDVNAGLGRQIVRQWEEVILGVPLLLTRIRYEDGGPKSTLIGLLYSSAPQKLHFRLNSSQEQEEKAEAAWRQILSTTRTLDGQVPAVQQPGVEAPPPAAQPQAPKVQRIGPRASESVKGLPKRQEWPVTGVGQELVLKGPEGWSLTRAEEGYSLAHEGLSAPVLITLGSGTSKEAQRAVHRRMGQSLAGYAQGASRQDLGPSTGPSGAEVLIAIRLGEAADGPRAEAHASGATGLFHWIASYQAPRGEAWPKEEQLLRKLFESLSLERPA